MAENKTTTAAPALTLIWDGLKKTDPKYTKTFKRGGGFTGTAIAPMHMIQQMTAMFGPVGIGWGFNEPEFETYGTATEGELLVYSKVSLWYAHPTTGQISKPIFGVGGDFIVKQTKNGLHADDEAKKKAFTDACSNAMKYLGVGADVHLGLFDDNKYVDQVEREFSIRRQAGAKSATATEPAAQPAKPAGSEPASTASAAGAPASDAATRPSTLPARQRPAATPQTNGIGDGHRGDQLGAEAGEPGGGPTPEPEVEAQEQGTWADWALGTMEAFKAAPDEPSLLALLEEVKPPLKQLKSFDLPLYNKVIAQFRADETRTRAVAA